VSGRRALTVEQGKWTAARPTRHLPRRRAPRPPASGWVRCCCGAQKRAAAAAPVTAVRRGRRVRRDTIGIPTPQLRGLPARAWEATARDTFASVFGSVDRARVRVRRLPASTPPCRVTSGAEAHLASCGKERRLHVQLRAAAATRRLQHRSGYDESEADARLALRLGHCSSLVSPARRLTTPPRAQARAARRLTSV